MVVNKVSKLMMDIGKTNFQLGAWVVTLNVYLYSVTLESRHLNLCCFFFNFHVPMKVNISTTITLRKREPGLVSYLTENHWRGLC